MTTIKITDATSEPITLNEAKAHLHDLVEGESDADILQLITDARTECENRLRRTLLPTTWLKTMDAFPCRRDRIIDLPRPPLRTVQWIKYLDPQGVERTLDPAAYLVNPFNEPGQVVPTVGSSWPATLCQPGAGVVKIQFTAGYADADAVPGPIKRWIKLAMTDLYENRARSSERPMLPSDFADGLLDAYTMWAL